MGKYYYLIAGLPSIALDDSKITYSVDDFRTELEGMLSSNDKRLMDLFYLRYENSNLLSFVKNRDAEFDKRGLIAYEDLEVLYNALRDDEKPPRIENLPPYFINFIKQFLSEQDKESGIGNRYISWEDRLAAMYYEYAMKCGNRFVADWFELNLNINNLLTAITCRKHGLEKLDYIVGNNEISEAIRTSGARDFGLGDEVDYLPELQRIAEESDLMAREKRVDLLKWQWLEDNSFFKTFDIESLFAYLMKLDMIERWVKLDRVTGEKTFRGLVSAMKVGSDKALEEFKRNNTK